jgi:hypothetical protein
LVLTRCRPEFDAILFLPRRDCRKKHSRGAS